MSTSRRKFLQSSATAAAAFTIAPIERAATGSKREDPKVKAFEDRLIHAHPLALEKVRLTGGPLKHAQDITAAYLLSLDPDRMMAYYRERAALPKKAEPYGGWDGGGRNLTGHIAGHHLSAVSYMYRALGDVRFKERADYLVGEMKIVQDKNGDGYLGALEGGREAFAKVSRGEIKSGGFDLNGLWSPWYTLHKTFAGLRDAYRHAGNQSALAIETKYARWAEKVLAPLTDAQVQKMLETEHGGMNEVLADLYADTGDRRWLELSYRFEHRAFTDPLKHHQDNLSGKHGNCQIPKLMGSAARYGYTGDASDLLAASFFWDRVVQHHSYSSGGHGLAEYFGPPDELSTRVDGRTCESCNVYNMLKLTRRLFSFNPDAHLADFHERALFNHYLASIDPQDARTSYMVPVGRGVQQEYQDMQRSFTCCVGTGMEGHALHGYGIYYESADRLWVNLFAPSAAQFTNGVKLNMETGFPDGDTAKITLTTATPKTFTLAVRRPIWAGDAFAIIVNGTAIPQPPVASLHNAAGGGRGNAPGNEAGESSTFVEVKRTWRSGDTVELTLPKALRLEPTPDDRTVASIMWGPLALAGDQGPRREGRATRAPEPPVPVLVTGDHALTSWVLANGQPGNFKAAGVAHVPLQGGAAGDVELTPFWRTSRRRYSLYFDVLTPTEFAERESSIAAERARVAKIEASTVGFVQPGEMQPERDYNYRSEPEERPVGRAGGRANRAGTGWFSFDMPVDATKPMAVVVTYFNELGLPPANGNFAILVDDTEIATFAPNATATGFYFAEYRVPGNLVAGKSRVTVKFRAAPNGRIAPVFGVRTVRVE